MFKKKIIWAQKNIKIEIRENAYLNPKKKADSKKIRSVENITSKNIAQIKEQDSDSICSSNSDESQDVAFFDCIVEREG